MINKLSLPRKYTTTHNDFPPKLFLAIGHEYDKCLLSSEEVINQQTQVIGGWIKKHGKYEIHLDCIVSDASHPDAKARNEEFCRYMAGVLETIGFGEAHLLMSNPSLARTKIFVHFKSIDPAYDRVEYWHRLGHWAPKCIKEEDSCKDCNKHDGESKKEHKKKSKKDYKKSHHRIPPQVCKSCK
jgi:hypothetical protein